MIGLYLAMLGTEPAARERAARSTEANLPGNEEFLLLGISNVYRTLGLADDANRALKRYESWASSADVGAGGWTLYYAIRRDPVQTLQWFETAVERLESGIADPGFISLQTLPGIDALLADEPRYPDLRQRLEALKEN
jgi:hypothetical protein